MVSDQKTEFCAAICFQITAPISVLKTGPNNLNYPEMARCKMLTQGASIDQRSLIIDAAPEAP